MNYTVLAPYEQFLKLLLRCCWCELYYCELNIGSVKNTAFLNIHSILLNWAVRLAILVSSAS